ncbi:MAG: LptF/LptG family permease [Verrucomicrobiota bacterium]
MPLTRNHLRRFLLPLVLAVAGAALCALLLPAESAAVRQQLSGFPDSDVATQQLRPLVLTALCFLPALAALFYAFGGILDRYIAREFMAIFGICLTALSLIWLIMDLNDKVGDLRNSQDFARTLVNFYATRSPAMLLLLMPYSLLLSLLYALGKLSTNREIIAMVQSGRSVVRITLPLLIAGVGFSLFCLGLNYHWAPVAEGSVDQILAHASGKGAAQATNVLFLNPSDRRLWKIGSFPPDYHQGGALENVEVIVTRPDHSLASQINARKASWDRSSRRWTFTDATRGEFSPGKAPIFEKMAEPLTVENWPETPFQLIKPGISASFLGIPGLTTWLQSNARNGHFASPAPYLTQWHYRWALPFSCLVTVLLATPLAVHFARRGPGGGIFLAVVFSGLMLLVSSISVAFGESGGLAPAKAAWLPNIAFALLGLYLFRRRITGRPIYLVLRRLIPGND